MSEIYVSANPLTIFFFLVLDTLRHSLAYKRCIAMWGDAFIEHGVIGKIFVAKKYLITPSVFKLQKWFLHQNGVEFNKKSKSDLTKLWPVVGR